MMGTEWVVGQHVPSDYQVSIDSFIGIFTLLLNRYLAVYQLNTFAIYLGNLIRDTEPSGCSFGRKYYLDLDRQRQAVRTERQIYDQ